jgi:hypothetical protein
MEQAMHPTLKISAEWERLDNGSPEERAAFASLGIQANNHWLTEGHDGFVNRIRTEPYLSAYHLAEWLAWNWWRLRWEPRASGDAWSSAHRLTTIGSGYVWPNVTIFSDGERTALISKPSEGRGEATVFRYVSDYAAVVSSVVFERAIDEFCAQVMGRLHAESLPDTNLHRIWEELTAERRDVETTKRRKLEALLGHDPDESDAASIDKLLIDARTLGEKPIEELAAESGRSGRLLTAERLAAMAGDVGFDASPNDVVRLGIDTVLPSARDTPAWLLGSQAARALRSQQKLGDGRISNTKLQDLAGVERSALHRRMHFGDVSFALDQSQTKSRVVLRSKWPEGRRFELARLLGDRIVNPPFGKLHAATRTYTYRQKMQRSFAAEFLSPFESVNEMLDGDYSQEAQSGAAYRFGVSEITIRTLLVNHHRIERDQLAEEDLEAA